MKKIALVAFVVLLLVPLLAVPAEADRWRHGRGGGWHHGGHRGHGGFWIGVGVGALVTAPWWYYPTYSYPVYYPYPVYYGYPAYAPTYTTAPEYTPPPATMTPTPQPLSPAPQGGTEGAPPQSGGQAAPPPPQTSQNCQTVWVEGHYETRVMPNGQRVTVWVPAHSQQICQ